MVPNDGWYLIGPLLAVGLVVLLGALLQRTLDRDTDPLREAYADGLAILDAPAVPGGEDYGLLRPVTMTDDPWLADDIRRLLVGAGIRATHGVRPDGRLVVLVFDSEAEEARRLVGDSPV
ncbi:MAG TPA: hypothetical protein VF657_04185, partial [Actinoplanes sp.]